MRISIDRILCVSFDFVRQTASIVIDTPSSSKSAKSAEGDATIDEQLNTQLPPKFKVARTLLFPCYFDPNISCRHAFTALLPLHHAPCGSANGARGADAAARRWPEHARQQAARRQRRRRSVAVCRCRCVCVVCCGFCCRVRSFQVFSIDKFRLISIICLSVCAGILVVPDSIAGQLASRSRALSLSRCFFSFCRLIDHL